MYPHKEKENVPPTQPHRNPKNDTNHTSAALTAKKNPISFTTFTSVVPTQVPANELLEQLLLLQTQLLNAHFNELIKIADTRDAAQEIDDLLLEASTAQEIDNLLLEASTAHHPKTPSSTSPLLTAYSSSMTNFSNVATTHHGEQNSVRFQS